MSADNLQQLSKLTKLINLDKIITSDEIEQVLASIVKVLANNKKSVEELNANTKQHIQDVLNQVSDSYKQSLEEVRKESLKSSAKSVTEVENTINLALAEFEAIKREIMAMKPQDGEDGKDADAEQIITSIMERIKLPEYKEFVLDGTGKDIVDEVNTLPTDDDKYKIDYSHIKNGPKNLAGGGGGVKNREVQIYDLSSQLDGSTKTFNLPAFNIVFDVRSSSFPYAFRPTVDYTTDGNLMTITFTDEITASATLAQGQTLYVLYLTI